MSSLAIGFTNKYFTLWNVGGEYPVYIKNISTDENIARAKYPNLEVFMDLKGMHNRYGYKIPEIPPFDGTFSKGKFKGTLVEGTLNEDYMKWYVENDVYSTKEEREAIVKEVEKFGNWKYGETGYFVRIIPQKELDEIERVTKEMLSGTFEMFMERNLDEFGKYTYYDKFNNWYDIQFENFKEMYYAGYYYGLPVLNGKSKRVKNKTLRLTEVEKVGDKRFVIKNFEIV